MPIPQSESKYSSIRQRVASSGSRPPGCPGGDPRRCRRRPGGLPAHDAKSLRV